MNCLNYGPTNRRYWETLHESAEHLSLVSAALGLRRRHRLDVFPDPINVNSLTPTITAQRIAVGIGASGEFGNASLEARQQPETAGLPAGVRAQ